MQIIIVQSEIETAIKNHILGRVAVGPDTEIDIDLKATRGSDGYQAIIDIRSKGTPRQEVCEDTCEDTCQQVIDEDPIEPEEGNESPDASESAGSTDTAGERPRRRRRTKAEMEAARAGALEALGGTLNTDETASEPVSEAQEDTVADDEAAMSITPEASSDEEAETVSDETAAKMEDIPVPRASIFSNLNKPVNQKTDA